MSVDLETLGAGTVTAAMAVALLKPVIVAALIVLAGYIIIRLVCKMLLRTLEKSKVDPVLFTFAVNCTKVVLWILVGLTAMSTLGIPPTSILTALGACGVAIALALQNSLSNFAGGVLIIVTKPFAKGDYINNLSVEGTVQQIDLLCTTIYTVDNKVITVPNGTLANNTIINYSRSQLRRLDLVYSIGYGDDIDKAKDVVLAVAESSGMFLREPEPVIGVGSHGESAVLLDVKLWCKNADYWNLYYYMNEQVKAAFDEQGISIPYPQVDVHMNRTK